MVVVQKKKNSITISNEVSEAFSIVLKKWRQARGLNQSELAEMCNLDRTFISLLERGQRQPSLTTVFSIANALDVSASELVHQAERLIKHSSRRRQAPSPSRRT